MIDNLSLLTNNHRTMNEAESSPTEVAAPAEAPEPEGALDPPTGRRERRKAETRRRLLDAASHLFAERGYHGTRPQDIARGADVASGTFYLHFADKSEAFLAFSERAAEELMRRIRAHASGPTDFESGLRSSLEALFEFAESEPGVLGAAFADAAVIAAGLPQGASLRDRLADSLAERLGAAMQAGELAADYDPHLVAHGIVGMIDAACVHGASRETGAADLIENLTRFCARALSKRSEERQR